MRWSRVVVVAASLAVSACSLWRSHPPPVVNGRQEGIASWYGPGFHGKRTANGEVYDQYDLTAAHTALPLGTRVMVTSLTNGRSVEVRINDRGPFIGDRIIDLSYGAARVLGMIGPGTMPVRVEVLDAPVRVAAIERPRPRSDAPRPAIVPAPPPVAAAPPPPMEWYGVLVATLSDAGRAEHLRSRIALKFPEVRLHPVAVGSSRYYRIDLGPFPSRGVAQARAESVTRYGYPAVITEADAP